MFIDLDITDLPAFRAFCATHGIEVRGVIENGPAGGNPLVSITVYDGAALHALAEHYFGDGATSNPVYQSYLKV